VAAAFRRVRGVDNSDVEAIPIHEQQGQSYQSKAAYGRSF